MRKIIDCAVLGLIIVTLLVYFERLSAASLGGGPVPTPQTTQLSPTSELRARDVSRIIAVFEGKIGDAKLPRKAKNKLVAMDDEDFRLIALLCDRIAGTGNRAGADIAFLLAAALMVVA